MSGHTQGPWHIADECADLQREDAMMVESDSGMVAEVLGAGTDDESYANARIIAVAPTAVEILRELLEISKTDDWNGSGLLDDALERARECVRDAEGGRNG